jgi:hypothetical protein
LTLAHCGAVVRDENEFSLAVADGLDGLLEAQHHLSRSDDQGELAVHTFLTLILLAHHKFYFKSLLNFAFKPHILQADRNITRLRVHPSFFPIINII